MAHEYEFEILDGTGSIEKIHDKIKNSVKELLSTGIVK
jgi:thymidylate kinase